MLFELFNYLLKILPKYTEDELVQLLKQRDESAFRYLYDNYSPALYGVIYSIVPEGHTAQDVLQDSFVKIWRLIGQYEPAKGRLFTWMHNIARSGAIDAVRSAAWRNARKTEPVQDFHHSIAGASIEYTGLRKSVSKLAVEHRALIELSYFQGYTHEEIAKLAKIPAGTVKTRLRAAIKQLRKMISIFLFA
ncbi:RNA polymerase sigma factor [Chitinophaga rhizosphaerae]|uniref:RNA polymerase sigma factor n=1 Tax=Chitinophaga rhizosphaerae TaxID=1864947 RepID=UPI000F7FAD48|nr:sigma-70 family RNA polymerase sigma factor [Chitinophaga rhizosphaerae]